MTAGKESTQQAGEKPAANQAAAKTNTAQTNTAKPAKTKVPALKVSSAREGFRRGGQVFGREPKTVLLSELTKEQIAQIKGERLLAVSEVEVDAPSK